MLKNIFVLRSLMQFVSISYFGFLFIIPRRIQVFRLTVYGYWRYSEKALEICN